MANLEIYAIKDSVMGEFMNPYLQHNMEHARRTLKEVVNSGAQTDVVKNAKDMQLFKLGEFDSKTGTIKSDIQFVVNASQLIEKRGEQNYVPTTETNTNEDNTDGKQDKENVHDETY